VGYLPALTAVRQAAGREKLALNESQKKLENKKFLT